jgi:hypothetical protein
MSIRKVMLFKNSSVPIITSTWLRFLSDVLRSPRAIRCLEFAACYQMSCVRRVLSDVLRSPRAIRCLAFAACHQMSCVLRVPSDVLRSLRAIRCLAFTTCYHMSCVHYVLSPVDVDFLARVIHLALRGIFTS